MSTGILERLSQSQARVGRGSLHYGACDWVKDITTWAKEHIAKLVFVSIKVRLCKTADKLMLQL